ncbi:MAG: RNA-binding transcriptional accessory protein [Candidatus Omnitrophica bacterium]|nr:RNA-binding transcriptional accessory protein [Candidatus Omnitrophota bacterium]
MHEQHLKKIAQELRIPYEKIEATARLLDDGDTIPFLSRYRKEVTGNLDEVAITSIRDRLAQLREMDKRRVTILSSIQEQGKLTDELKKKIEQAETLAVLEDIYLPYKPKRRTKATVAKEKGLEPLAKLIFDQTGLDAKKLEEEAAKFIHQQKVSESAEKKEDLSVNNTEEALAGARDIIAEWISENANARAQLRKLYQDEAMVSSKMVRGKEQEGIKFRDYFNWEEKASTTPSHRMLAVRRGEKEKFLMVRMTIPADQGIALLDSLFVKGNAADSRQVSVAVADSFKRLLDPSLETELRLELKKKADEAAIQVFASNMRELLMAPPLGEKNVMAVDPGLRTGCKIVCLDKQGKLLTNTAIYLVGSDSQKEQAANETINLCKKYNIEMIAVGNGTASRETEQFLKGLKFPTKIPVVMVSESGASIYSASDVAREEFPDYDVTVRGAVSIGRRLMDPLAELVKIDPKNIGVGQYQHDVDQHLLKQCLDDVVISSVNQVGVEVNTASKQLLMYVSGLGPARAQMIIDYRNAHGPFQSREEFKSITGLGTKAFEQAAGFLRIRNAPNPLDSSGVHPETYMIVDKMAKDIGCEIKDLTTNESFRNKIDLNKYVTENVGLPTLRDIKEELAKPGRDPREPFSIFSFKEGVETINDLKEGMKLSGVVTNITAFGAFVDIGVHHDGLIHISELSNRFVKDPHEVVKVHQKIDVTVLQIDMERMRIALSAKK